MLQVHVLRRIKDVSTADEGVEEIRKIAGVDEDVGLIRRIFDVVDEIVEATR